MTSTSYIYSRTEKSFKQLLKSPLNKDLIAELDNTLVYSIGNKLVELEDEEKCIFKFPNIVRNVFSRYGAALVITSPGSLYVKTENHDFELLELVQEPRVCCHGVASTQKDSLHVIDAVCSSSEVVVLDKLGALWAFKWKKLKRDRLNRALVRAVPLMGGMRRCLKLAAGRNYFLALFTTNALVEEDEVDCSDESTSRKSAVIQEKAELFSECPECQDDSRLRLSSLMKSADMEADLMKTLEEDEAVVRDAGTRAQSLRLLLDSPESSPLHHSTPHSASAKPQRIRMRDVREKSRTLGDMPSSSREVDKEATSISFLSLDHLSLQLQESPDPSPECTPNKRRPNIDDEVHHDDDFVEVWSWGENECGQLGQGDTINRRDPFPISSLTTHRVVSIHAGDSISAVLTSNGEVYVWGSSLQSFENAAPSYSPQLFKIGFTQTVMDASIFGTTLSLLIHSPAGEPFICICEEGAETKRTVSRLPQRIKGEVPVSVRVVSSQIVFGYLPHNCDVIESLTVWMEAISTARLLSSLTTLTQQMHENNHLSNYAPLGKATCAEDDGATASSLFQKLHLAIASFYSIAARTASTARDMLSVSHCADPLEHLIKLCTFPLLQSSRIYFSTLSDAIGYGCFRMKDVSESSEQLISRLCLEHDKESGSLHSRLLKLFSQPVDFWTTIRNNAGELMHNEADDGRQAQLKELMILLKELISFANTNIGNAKRTEAYWREPIDSNTCRILRHPGRFFLSYYIVDSELLNITTLSPKSAFGSPKFHTILVFTDVLVLLEKKDYRMFPLELIWCNSESTDENTNLTLITPELRVGLEFKKAAVKTLFVSYVESWSLKQPAPRQRYGSHVFSQNAPGDCCEDRYEGYWREGKPSGRGTLRTKSGIVYTGYFVSGHYDGFGVLKVPCFEQSKSDSSFSSFFYNSPFTKTEKFTEYKGVFKQGLLCGLAHIRYATGEVYEGYCLNSEPHGFGLYRWDRGAYLGAFVNGLRSGYGVLTTRKEKYLGEWSEDKMHGRGARVTLDGSFHEGEWKDGGITYGAAFRPPTGRPPAFSTFYIGDLEDYGKPKGTGVAVLSGTTTLEGQLTGDLFAGDVKVISGKLTIQDQQPSPVDAVLHDEGPKQTDISLPASLKWRELFSVFIEEELGGQLDDCNSAWNRIVGGMRRGQELLTENDRWVISAGLDRIPSHESPWSLGYYAMVTEYVDLSLACAFHPLYRLINGVVEIYSSSYNNVAAHAKLYASASLELQSLIERVYDIIRILFPALPDSPYCTLPTVENSEIDKTDQLSIQTDSPDKNSLNGSTTSTSSIIPEVPTPCCEFLYAYIFPRVSPAIYTIYSLATETLNAQYWNRAVYLNAHTDVKLLTYLEVPKVLWPIDIPNAGDLEKPFIRATARKKFYESAITTLQQLSTDANPVVKLSILAETFQEIIQCVSRYAEAGSSHIWGSDDLLPAFMYVVVRAQIQHLGCEIKLLDDFTRHYRGYGQVDLMFTMLKSSYVQIINEKGLA